MLLWKFFLYLEIVLKINALDAISYFVKNKRVKSLEITNLNDSWVEYKYKFHSTNKKNLTDINLKIAITNENNFDCKMENKSGKVTFSGYSVKLVEKLQAILKFKAEYIILRSNTSLASLLNSKDVDMIICHPHYSKRKEHVLQLYDTINTKYIVVYKVGKMYKTNDIFVLTFVGSLWLVFLVVLIVLAVCLKISTSYYAEMGKAKSKWNWAEITLWAIAAACQQGLSHCPERFASRFIFFIGYVTSYLLYTGFAAGITSILVRQDLNSFDFKLIGSRYLKIYCFYCADMKMFGKSVMPVGSISELLDELETRDTVAVVPELYIQEYFAEHFNYETAGNYIMTSVPGVRYVNGFLLQPNSQWTASLNSAILSLREFGVLRLARSVHPVFVPEEKSAYSSAGQEHVGSATYLFLTGVLAAALLLLVEFLMASYRNYRQKRRTSAQINKASL